MTVSTALKELEKLLSEARGPDREIDFRIAALTDEQMAADLRVADGITYSSNGEFVLTFKSPAGKLGRGFYGNHMVPQFTHSLDAAVSFCERVLPGSGWLVGRGRLTPSEPLFGATVYATDMADEPEELGGAEGPSPALALCLAAVRALIAKEKE